MNTSYQIVEAKSMDGGELAISLPWEFELSEIFVVAEHEKSGIAKVYEGAGTLNVDGDGNLVVPALFGGDAFRVWVSRKTQIRHDYDSGGDVIDDKTIDSELKELSRKTVENEKELARSVRVPEGGVNMILPSKVFRAGEIVGFDEDGNVSVGKGIPRIAELYANFEKVESSRKEAARHESVAKQNADIAIENRIAANKSAEDAHKYAQQLSGIYRYCGTVATEADLPTENNINGDVWNVADTGQNFAWDGEAWDALAGDVFATKEDLAQKANDADVVHKTGEETIAGPKKFTSSINIGGKTLLETNVGAGVLKFTPVGSTAQTVLKRDGTNVVIQTQNAGVVQSTWTLPGGKTGTVAMDSDVVHKTGDETITGSKGFEGAVSIGANGSFTVNSANPAYFLNGLSVDGVAGFTGSIQLGFAPGSGSLSVLPLGTTTALGATAYGLHVSAKGGLQLFGTHFLNGTLWDDTVSPLMPGLKIVNNNLSLYSTGSAAIGFDYANEVIFRTMPNDGNEATYKLEAWEWTDDSHTTKAATAGVKLLKPSQATELVPTSVLNVEEGDARYVKLGTPNGADDDCTYLVVGDRIARLAACETDSEYVVGTALHDASPAGAIAFDKTTGVAKIYNGYKTILFPTKSGTLALTSDVSAVDLTEGGTISGSLEFVSETGLEGAIVPNAYGFMFAPDSCSTAEVGFGAIRGAPCVYTYNNTIYTFPTAAGGGEVTVATLADLANYVPKSDYDALLARVEALEAAAG